MATTMTLAEIATLIGGTLVGDGTLQISGVASTGQAAPGLITFVTSTKYAKTLATTTASAALVPPGWDAATTCPVIEVADVNAAFTTLYVAFAPAPVTFEPGVHASAVVDATATLGPGVHVGANAVIEAGARVGAGCIVGAGCYIGHETVVGDNCLFHANVTIRERCTIGDRAIFHCGAVVGADGFGFAMTEGVWKKIPQVGTVEIGDDVELGANSAVDRARFGVTKLGHGVKIDNFCQIAHNVVVGDHTAMAAYAGMAGSSCTGHHVMLAGRASIVNHCDVGSHVFVAAAGIVTHDIPDNSQVAGYPALDKSKWSRIQMSQQKLPEMRRKLKQMERRLAELEKGTDA